jgi:hypothetical protein
MTAKMTARKRLLLAVPLFLCLLIGPHARWVRRFLPDTANRLLFIAIVVALIVASVIEGTTLLHRGQTFGGYFYITQALLCGSALIRFPYIWWFKSETPIAR